jgi:hypothetical protein
MEPRKLLRLTYGWGTFTLVLVALLTPTTGWAHECGPQELTVEKGNTIVYSIVGYGFVPSYEIRDKGDPQVAVIEPPVDIDNVDLEFKITGTGEGTTMFKVYWKGPNRRATCSIKVTVTG